VPPIQNTATITKLNTLWMPWITKTPFSGITVNRELRVNGHFRLQTYVGLPQCGSKFFSTVP
jgi:hypothetical protein